MQGYYMAKKKRAQCSRCNKLFEYSYRGKGDLCPSCRQHDTQRRSQVKRRDAARIANGLPPLGETVSDERRAKSIIKKQRKRNKLIGAELLSKGLKSCRRCNEVKPTDTAFSKDRSQGDGFSAYCKECVKVYQQANSERMIANAKRWQQENPEKAAAAVKRWHKNNSAKAAEIAKRRRAHEVSTLYDFTEQDWQYALEYFNGCCAVCGRQMSSLFREFYPAQDHWQPLSKGGHTIPENIVPLCHGLGGCNNSKSDILPQEWLERRFGKRKAKAILARITEFFTTVRKVS